MADGQINFLSGDSASNPLLDMGLRPDLFGSWLIVLGVLLVIGLSYSSFADLWRGRLTPNWFTHGLIGFALLAGPLLFEDWVLHLAIGAGTALVFGLLWQIGGIGMGDVKLYVGLALLFGSAGILIIALAQIVSALVGVPVALLSGRGRKMAIPMFPFVTFATLVVMSGLGAEGRLILAGFGLLAVACLYGLAERRLRPPLGLEELAAAVIDGRAPAVRLRPWQRPILPDADGGWADPDAQAKGTPATGPRARRRDLDLLSHRILSSEQLTRLDRVGEVTGQVRIGGTDLALRFIEGLDGYTVDVRSENRREDHGVLYAPPLPALSS